LTEVLTPRLSWSKAPRQVSIALTNACDLTCAYCYAPKHAAMIRFDRLVEWIKELDDHGCIGVGFGGGEPCIYPKLTELCRYGARETNLAITMTTHAHRLTDALLQQLSTHVHFVRVSMDGIGRTYEENRGRSFESLVDRIQALSKISRFGINFVVNSKTVDELESATDLAAALGASEFLLLPELPVGGFGGIDEQARSSLQRWVENYHGKVPLSISESGSEGIPTCNPFESESGIRAYAHIDASEVLKRTSYAATGIPIGESGLIGAVESLQRSAEESEK